MTPAKIISVIEKYEARLQATGLLPQRMDPARTFGELTPTELLAHAYFLCEGAKKYAKDPLKQRKAGSHLTAIQMCLGFVGWYTLAELMEHNRPATEVSEKPVEEGRKGFREPSWAT